MQHCAYDVRPLLCEVHKGWRSRKNFKCNNQYCSASYEREAWPSALVSVQKTLKNVQWHIWQVIHISSLWHNIAKHDDDLSCDRIWQIPDTFSVWAIKDIQADSQNAISRPTRWHDWVFRSLVVTQDLLTLWLASNGWCIANALARVRA